MLERWTATIVVVVGLGWPTVGWAAEPEPPTPAPALVPEKVPEKAPEAPPAPAPTRVPDGVFVGTFAAAGGPVVVRLVVAGGALVDGAARLTGGVTLPLEAAGTFDTPRLQAGGELELDYVRVSLDFFDADRGAGTFEGVLGRQRVAGAWTVERR